MPQHPQVPQPPIPKPQLHLTKRPQQWIPKAKLEAQGYYKGNTQVWLPKQRKAESQPKLNQQQPQSKKSYHSAKQSRSGDQRQQLQQQWVPKTSLQVQGFYRGKHTIWLPKHKAHPSASPQPTKLQHPAQQQSKIPTSWSKHKLIPKQHLKVVSTLKKQSKLVWQPKTLHLPQTSQAIIQRDATVTIKERAQLLRQLFTNTLSQSAVVQFFDIRQYGLIPFPSYETVQAQAQLHINSICTKHSTSTDIPWQLYTY